MSTLQAVFDGVIVKPIEEEDTLYGNIIVPDVGKEKSNVAEVISVGPGKHSITGDKFIETTINVGDKVILQQWDLQNLILKEKNIIFVQKTWF